MNSPQITPVVKQEGVTRSERYLKALCEKSFLSLWSYPNVYRNQGKRNSDADGKEVCDLLVVFDNHVIIFSDKSCTFRDSGNIEVDWRRWYKRSIEESADQIFGAERWIRQHPDRLFLDPKCSQKFPLDLPNPATLRVHRIVVALGAGVRCREMHGGSGSLVLCPEASPPTAPAAGSVPAQPFAIGQIAADKPFVHVFDDFTLDIVLRELDTISDFLNYLSAKEALIAAGKLIFSTGEENLLAYYLRNIKKSGEYYFHLPEDGRGLGFGEDLWEGLRGDPVYLRFKKANEASYEWDRMLEIFNQNILDGKMVEGNERGVAGHERRVRALARPTRFARRQLTLTLAHLFQTSDPKLTSMRAVVLDTQPDTGYLFLLVPRQPDEDYDHVYRVGRGNMLLSYCMVLKHLNPDLRHVVGIAMDAKGSENGSEEIVYIDGTDWRPEDDEAAQEIRHRYGLMTELKLFRGNFAMYPDETKQAHPRDVTSHDRQKAEKAERKKKRKREAQARRKQRMRK